MQSGDVTGTPCSSLRRCAVRVLRCKLADCRQSALCHAPQALPVDARAEHLSAAQVALDAGVVYKQPHVNRVARVHRHWPSYPPAGNKRQLGAADCCAGEATARCWQPVQNGTRHRRAAHGRSLPSAHLTTCQPCGSFASMLTAMLPGCACADTSLLMFKSCIWLCLHATPVKMHMRRVAASSAHL